MTGDSWQAWLTPVEAREGNRSVPGNSVLPTLVPKGSPASLGCCQGPEESPGISHDRRRDRRPRWRTSWSHCCAEQQRPTSTPVKISATYGWYLFPRARQWPSKKSLSRVSRGQGAEPFVGRGWQVRRRGDGPALVLPLFPKNCGAGPPPRPPQRHRSGGRDTACPPVGPCLSLTRPL